MSHSGLSGIVVFGSGTVTGNTASRNRIIGISGVGTVTGIMALFNASFGLALSPETGYSLNVVATGAFGAGTVSGGVSLGQNLCNGVVC